MVHRQPLSPQRRCSHPHGLRQAPGGVVLSVPLFTRTGA